MNVFYEEVLVSADPDKGIGFNSLLMILAHHKVINDNKSLRLEEYLRRRARLQRVEEAVRRNVVIGFFDTVFWSRRFRRTLAARNLRDISAPHFSVPEIYIDDDGDAQQPSGTQHDDGYEQTETFVPSPILSPQDRAQYPRAGPIEPAPISPPLMSPPNDHILAGARARSSSIQISPSNSPTRGNSLQVSPQLTPRHRPQHSEDWQFAEALTGMPPSPSHSRNPSQQAYLYHTDGGNGGLSADREEGQHGRNRGNSNVSAQDVLEVLDNSAWGESIRKSFTLRRGSPGRER
jgi:voltage-dependent calcium channel